MNKRKKEQREMLAHAAKFLKRHTDIGTIKIESETDKARYSVELRRGETKRGSVNAIGFSANDFSGDNEDED